MYLSIQLHTCKSVNKLTYLLTYLLATNNRQKMTAKHRSVNNVLWKVVAGGMRSAYRQLDNSGLRE